MGDGARSNKNCWPPERSPFLSPSSISLIKMDVLFCCESITPYKPKRLDHESKFTTFLSWARATNVEQADDKVLMGDDPSLEHAPYVIQLVRQVNYGALEWKRYFTPVGSEDVFIEISEKKLIDANFKKLNT